MPERQGRLAGKVCLITGAGSGMGRVAAERFAAEDALVVAADRDGAAVERAVAEIGGGALALTMDVTDDGAVRDAVAAIERRHGRLDVLYNNAGIFPDEDGSVVDIDDALWDRVQDVNLKGVFHCCKHAIPLMRRDGGGSIVNIASFVALVGCSVPQDAYTATKGAVIALTKSLAVQYGPDGIRANAICPGPIETPLLAELLRDPAKRALRLNRVPLGRLGRPEDIVHLALHLASDEASWTTGGVFVVDGGITSNYF